MKFTAFETLLYPHNLSITITVSRNTLFTLISHLLFTEMYNLYNKFPVIRTQYFNDTSVAVQ